LEASGLKQVDISAGISSVLAIKDETALKFVKGAASISSAVLKKHAVPMLEAIIDEEQKITHSELADKLEDLFRNASKISPKLNPEFIDSCYTPIIQSGGDYDLKPSACSTDEELHFGTILVSLGARYKLFCSNIARTYLIDPTPEQKENYNLLLEIQQQVIDALKPGNKISKVMEVAMEYLEVKNPKLKDKFVKSCGFGIGVEYREAALSLTSKNERIIQSGMVFNIILGFSNLQIESEPDDSKKKNICTTFS